MDETEATVAAVRDVGPDTVTLDIETPAGFDARPGQFVKLSATVEGERESRFYTISSPDVTDTFEVTIGIDPEGTLGPYFAALEAGEQLTMAGPFGNAYYEDDPRVVVLAGGPGVGPAIGLAERALADGGEAAVVYQDEAPVHRERLDAIEADGALVHIVDPDDDLTAAVAEAITGAEGEQVFVYGFADFLDAATTAIDAAGGEPDAAKMENFG